MPKSKKKTFKKIKLLFFSASRAEYGMQKYFINYFRKNKKFKISFLTSGSHTSHLAVGDTSKQIKIDKINVSKKFQISLKSNTSKDAAKYAIILQKAFFCFAQSCLKQAYKCTYQQAFPNRLHPDHSIQQNTG